jgi:hypothetical protein
MAAQEEQARKMMEEQAKKMGQLTAEAWADENFKKKLLSDPAAMLKAEGVKIALPDGGTLKAVENTDEVFHIIIPARPAELSNEDLDKVAGGIPICILPTTQEPMPPRIPPFSGNCQMCSNVR